MAEKEGGRINSWLLRRHLRKEGREKVGDLFLPCSLYRVDFYLFSFFAMREIAAFRAVFDASVSRQREGEEI